MKKTLAILTALAVMLSAFAPAFAQEPDSAKKLEELIVKVKSVIDIPAEYETFTSNQRTESNGTVHWSLNWSEPSAQPSYYGNISGITVDINENGLIEGYSKYGDLYQYSEIVRLPAISKQEANDKVKAFIAKVIPEIQDHLEWSEPSVSNGNYFYNFSRIENGVPFPENMASFSLNGQTGEILNYYSYWNAKAVFESPDKAISLEKAQAVFAEKIPLQLQYKVSPQGRVYLQYTPAAENGGKYINAVTGEIDKNVFYYGAYESAKGMAGQYYDSVGLTPKEQKEVDEVANVLTAADAEKKLRGISELKLDDSYKLSSSYLSQFRMPYYQEPLYNLSLYFTKLDNTEGLTEEEIKQKIAIGEGRGYANATFNAKTGELLNFSSDDWNVYKTDKATASRTEFKKTADAFIVKMQPEKAGAIQFADNDNTNLIYQYYRVENGIPFVDNGISAGVDEQSGKIKEFNVSWYDGIEIPKPDGVIGIDKAHGILFEKVGLKLTYISNNDKVVLSYQLSEQKPRFIDAMSGGILDYSGNPFVATASPSYNDIQGHFSEQAVNTLLMVGVFLEGEAFKPDNSITQLEYLRLLSKLGKYYGERNDIEGLYKYFIQNGIMDAAEKSPDAPVTREDAVKYLLRYLGFKKFAEIKGIFKTEFKDEADISENLLGYAAIAQGIGIISGSDGSFLPKKTLTKGEAAVVIYNCLMAGIN